MRRFFGGLQPLWGTGVTSAMLLILRPSALRARTADSRPGPGPLIRTSRFLTPHSCAARPACSAATCAANGVDFLEPLKPAAPEVAHAKALPARGRGADRVFIETTNPAVARLQGSLVELQLERNNLALELTDRHPRIQVLDDQIREVEAELRRELAAQVAQLRTREEILNRQIGDLFQKNRELPAVELALQRMQREAKVNDDLLTLLKTKHQEALIKEAERVDEVTIVRPASEPTA